MKLDLQKDFIDIYDFVVRRVRSFDPAKNAGPGNQGEIKMIDIGYQCNQAGWVALVFDTRPDAEPDGKWTGYIEENWFPREHWFSAYDELQENSVTLVMTNGEVRQLQKGSEDELSLILGDMLKSVLFKSRDTGLFASLPKAKQCHIGMEEFDGTHYGWPPYEDRGKIDLI